MLGGDNRQEERGMEHLDIVLSHLHDSPQNSSAKKKFSYAKEFDGLCPGSMLPNKWMNIDGPVVAPKGCALFSVNFSIKKPAKPSPNRNSFGLSELDESGYYRLESEDDNYICQIRAIDAFYILWYQYDGGNAKLLVYLSCNLILMSILFWWVCSQQWQRLWGDEREENRIVANCTESKLSLELSLPLLDTHAP